jgi:beta-lactamase superfamily II metal-dependent hydrolase
MTFEIDVRAVGKESKSGDAIALRYGNFARRDLFRVVVIDGGFQSNGDDLIDLVKNTYGTDTVDLVVSTHPDSDHTSGLRGVIEGLKVDTLWMHLPWKHEKAVADYVTFGKSTKQFDKQLRESISTASELERLATKKGVTIVEPFAGLATVDGALRVLGPTRDYYRQLLSTFEDEGQAQKRGYREAIVEALKAAKAKVRELWGAESLQDPDADATRPQNNSSVILLAKLDQEYCLFTGDAGTPALEQAVPPEMGDAMQKQLNYMQMPHHGSKRNMGPTMLDRILGSRLSKATTTGKTVFISAAADGKPKHPSQQVVNAVLRRGAKVIGTLGKHLCINSADAPARPGWESAKAIEWAGDYEE